MKHGAAGLVSHTNIVMSILLLALLTLPVNTSLAKNGSDEKKRYEYYGIIKDRPQNTNYGQWIIGDESLKIDTDVGFDEDEGGLQVGGCAKVRFRDGRIDEIDSEPMRNCK